MKPIDRPAHFRMGILLGIECFLIIDMGMIHQFLRLHGILFSVYFEYAVLFVSVVFFVKALLTGKGP